MKGTIGVVGCGVVGQAVLNGFKARGFHVLGYDKFKPEYSDLDTLVASATIVFVCVNTCTYLPSGEQDLAPLHDVFKTLADKKYDGIVVIKSTVLPGTTKKLAGLHQILRYAHNPEFLTEVNAEEDFLKQPAVLIGGPDSGEVAQAYLAAGFTNVVERPTSASTEMAKYIHNLFLATKVSFFNEMYEHCSALDTDYHDALSAALAIGQIGAGHTRVPGPQKAKDKDGNPLKDAHGNPQHLMGFGGMCFVKDSTAFLKQQADLNLPSEVLKAVDAKNRRQRPGAYDGEEQRTGILVQNNSTSSKS